MKEITVKEFVQALEEEVIKVESMDMYGISFSFDKARIEYDEDMNEISFVAGNYNTPDGIGGVGICIDDVVDSIMDNDDGSYTIIFINQYMADVIVSKIDM